MNLDGAWVKEMLLVLGFIAGGGLVLRRRLSREKTDQKHDRAEEGLLSRLQSERDAALAEAQEARAQRTADAQTIARLQAEVEFLDADVKRLNGEVRKLKRLLPVEARKVLDTSFSPFPEDGPK